MINQQQILAARNKIVIARFLGDEQMWREAIRQYFFAIGGRVLH
ncbi:host cell division inhibitory peptide Kil [Serratia liquefaciens]